MKNLSLITLLIVVFVSPGTAQRPVSELRYESVPNFLKLPDDIHLGEGAAVATNSKGNVFVYSRMGSSYVTTGTEPHLVFSSPRSGSRLLEFDKNGNFIREIVQSFYAYNLAHGVRVDAQDNIWVVNEGANVVLKLDPAGRVLLTLGRESEVSFERQLSHANEKKSTDVGDGSGARADIFNRPTDVAFDSAGNIYVADGYGNSRIAKFDRNGKFLKSWGSRGKAPGQLNTPHSIAVDAQDNIYVGDRENSRIQVFDTEGNVKRQIANVGKPYAICISVGPHQYLYTSNSNGTTSMDNGEIYKLELDGRIIGRFGKAGKLLGEFGTTHGIDCRNPNEVFTAEVSTWRVQKLIVPPDQLVTTPGRN
jgi:DNA-binding beta-propeller fold protein YncE